MSKRLALPQPPLPAFITVKDSRPFDGLFYISLPLCAFPAKVASAALCKIFCTRKNVILLTFEHTAPAARF